VNIGAYCLCYREAEWLAENIRRLYARIDRFSVVIGPSERAYGYVQPPDESSEAILRGIPDPAGKITLLSREAWAHKNEMTAAATAILQTRFVFQLDADEFWPQATFDAALQALRQGADRVAAPHLIFWGGPDHVLRHPELGLHYFTPARFFRRMPGAELDHFDGRYRHPDGSVAPAEDAVLPAPMPVLHFGWVGEDRMARKLAFYRQARQLDMPDIDVFHGWIAAGRPPQRLQLGPNAVDIVAWGGHMEPRLRRWVQAMAAGTPRPWPGGWRDNLAVLRDAIAGRLRA
jgi:hypothetical protein